MWFLDYTFKIKKKNSKANLYFFDKTKRQKGLKIVVLPFKRY